MICGVAQGLLIKKNCARSAKKINYYRRKLREHVEGCAFCRKQIKLKRLPHTSASANVQKAT